MSDISYAGVSPDYGLMRQQAGTAWQQAQAQLDSRRRQLLDQSGFHYTVDPNGNLQLGQLDPAKQFGQFQMLMNQQGQELQNNANQQAGRNVGQFGMGAQADKLIHYNNANALQQQTLGFQNNLSDLDQQRQQGAENYQGQLSNIASQQGQFNAAQQQYQTQAQSAAQAQTAQGSGIQQLLALIMGGGF